MIKGLNKGTAAVFLLSAIIFYSCGSTEEPVYRPEIQTDRAAYGPGDAVTFSLAAGGEEAAEIIKFACYADDILIDSLTIHAGNEDTVTWTWIPPADLDRACLAVVKWSGKNGRAFETQIAADLSGKPALYPRYGFLSRFGRISGSEMRNHLEYLNRLHINWLQYYDWHYSHHDPLKGTPDDPADIWKDIADRDTYRSTVEYYLDAAHELNMKNMAYDLLYGAWGCGFDEGVREEWGLYHDREHRSPFFLDLPEGWADDIYFMNPGNRDWQNYLFGKMNEVFISLPFDGWHVDQIGDLDTLFTYDGEPVILKEEFVEFLTGAREQLNVPLVMNAVAQYGGREIDAAPVEFLYNEVWDPDSTYTDLLKIIEENRSFSGKNIVLPAYMNYGLADVGGMFNTASVLLTDAVIFAAGGAHLEMGEHMLVHEYFPNDRLSMTSELKNRLVSYYDFSVYRQEMLRGRELTPVETGVSSSEQPVSVTAEAGKIWVFSRQDDGHIYIHFINLTHRTDTNWRDPSGTQRAPVILKDFPVDLSLPRTVLRAAVSSPDLPSALADEVTFSTDQNGRTLHTVIPSLEYWTMLILDTEAETGDSELP